jgi:hypothetical protein
MDMNGGHTCMAISRHMDCYTTLRRLQVALVKKTTTKKKPLPLQATFLPQCQDTGGGNRACIISDGIWIYDGGSACLLGCCTYLENVIRVKSNTTPRYCIDKKAFTHRSRKPSNSTCGEWDHPMLLYYYIFSHVSGNLQTPAPPTYRVSLPVMWDRSSLTVCFDMSRVRIFFNPTPNSLSREVEPKTLETATHPSNQIS